VNIPRTILPADVPTAPLANVAFLVILLFLVTAVFSASKGLELELPPLGETDPQAVSAATLIKVEADGSIRVDCESIELHDLLNRLAPTLSGDPDHPVILYTDPYAPYQAMITVYDMLSSAERERGFAIRNIAVPTQSDVREYIESFGYNPLESRCGG